MKILDRYQNISFTDLLKDTAGPLLVTEEEMTKFKAKYEDISPGTFPRTYNSQNQVNIPAVTEVWQKLVAQHESNVQYSQSNLFNLVRTLALEEQEEQRLFEATGVK